MTGMGKPAADQQTWVYRTGTDSWQAGSTGGGGGGTGGVSAAVTSSYLLSASTTTQLYFPFDEPAGSSQWFSSGSSGSFGLSTTNIAHAYSTLGIYNRAVFFDGTQGSYLTGSNDANVGRGGSAFTISVWFFPTTFSGFNAICYKKYVNDTTWATPFVAYGIALNNTADGRVQYSVNTGGTLTQVISVSDTVGKARLNQWNHVALTYDGANMVGYLNGVEVGRTAKTGNIDFGTSPGNWQVGGDQSNNDNFFGAIDELRVEPITWPAEHIAAMYETGYVYRYMSGSAGALYGGSFNNINVTNNTTQLNVGAVSTFGAYYGFCTGSLLWNATGSWANALSVPGNFTDVTQNNVLRNGSVFTVLQTGLYNFRSFFNAMAGANGTYLAFRLSGSNGPVLSRTTFASDNPQPALMEGLFQATAGQSFTLQYLTSGSLEQTWSPSDPNGIGGDTQNMVVGAIHMFLIPSSSLIVTQSITNISSTLGGPGYPAANYAFVTQSNSFYFDSTVQGFVPVTGVSASITPTGSPVLIFVNGFWNAQTAGAQAYFSLTRDGVNLGSQYSGLQGAGPTAQSYGNNASFAFVDFGATPGVAHTYALVASGAVGQGELGAWGVGPTAIGVFEMKNANVVTASTTLTQAVPGGALTGLSANLFVNRGPVLAIISSNMSSDANGNWCWFDLFRNGSSLANGAGQGLSVNVGSATNEIQGNCIMVLDPSPTVGATNTYSVRATNGGGTNHINTNNLVSSLILFELTDVNYKYAFDTNQRTPSTSPSYSDVVQSNPSLGLVTRGRPVFLAATINSNTSGGGGRNGYSFFRNGINLTTGSKGMQLPDGEGNNDWNKMATMFWIDQVPAGAYTYQVEGTVVSSSAFTGQGSYTYLFMYEIDPGYQQGVIVNGWLDQGGSLFTTASVKIGGNLQVTGSAFIAGNETVTGTVSAANFNLTNTSQYYGYSSQNTLPWNSANWADFTTIATPWTDTISHGVNRIGNTFFVSSSGYYQFSCFFQGYGASGSPWLAFRLTGSNGEGTLLQEMTYVGNGNPINMRGVVKLNVGTTYGLQYATNGSANGFTGSISQVGGPDFETPHFCTISLFKVG